MERSPGAPPIAKASVQAPVIGSAVEVGKEESTTATFLLRRVECLGGFVLWCAMQPHTIKTNGLRLRPLPAKIKIDDPADWACDFQTIKR